MLANAARPTKERIRLLWAAAKTARDLAATDVVADTFIELAVETKLIDAKECWTGSDVAEHRRSYGRQDVAHVITWGLRGWNLFEQGTLT